MSVTIEGNGLITAGGTSTTQGRVRLAEDTDNGTNYIELTAPASVTSNQTITLPDNTGTIITTASTFGATGPAFAATRITSAQTGTQNNYVKVQFQSELFDTAGCYDPTTNYRFTPNVAGYYLFTTVVLNNPSSGTQTQLVTRFYKNGAPAAALTNMVFGGGIGGGTSTPLTELIYMNGTTDYVEVFQFSNATTPTYQAESYFSGCLVRAA